MKYSELFTTGAGVFSTVFNAEYPNQYVEIFGDIDPKQLDVYALLQYGNKTVVNTITTENASDVVSAVIAINLQGWQRQASAMLADYDVIKPITGEIERTETVTIQENTDNTETGANKAFNDTEFSDSDQRVANDEKNRTESRKTTETSRGTGASKSISTEIAKELRLRRDNWRKNIIFAIIKEITTSIYE